MTAGGPQFSATPQNPDLLRWVGIQVLLLVIAWMIGLVVRRLLASRMTMSTASATLTGLGGLWGGLLVAGWIFSSSDMWRPAMIGVAALVAAVVVVIVSLIVAYLHPRPGLEPIAEVAKRGESDSSCPTGHPQASAWSIASGRWISGAASSSRTGYRRGSLRRSSTRPRLRCRSCARCSGWSSGRRSLRRRWGLRRGCDAHAGI